MNISLVRHDECSTGDHITITGDGDVTNSILSCCDCEFTDVVVISEDVDKNLSLVGDSNGTG